MPPWSAALIVAAGGFALVVTFAFPRVAPASDVAIERTPERLARGRYLAENVMGCIGCHSPRMEDRYSFPAREGTEGAGGFVFSRSMGLPGNIVTKNITPHALGDWSDGEVVQAIAVGVSRDGEPLFPIMPYPGYRTFDQRDVYAVVAYLRTLAPVANDVAPRELDFPVGLMIRFVPADAAFSTRPEPSDGVAYGRYMATAGGCRECHTRIDSRGKEIGEPFAGGSEFPDPRGGGVARSANITPDEGTGIGGWSRDEFIERFKANTKADYRQMMVARGEPNTPMPWWEYAGMTREDLGAIYDYLRTVAPVRGEVVTFEAKPAAN